MSKEITKSIVLQQLQDRLKLRDYETAKFLFDETVVPTFDIREELQQHQLNVASVNVIAAGNVFLFRVPFTERWTLERYDVVFMGAGAYTVAGVNINRGGVDSVYLDLTAAQTVSYHVELPKPVVLGPLDELWINIDGYTSPQFVRLYIDYIMEEIR